MITFRDIFSTLKSLPIPAQRPVLVHADLSALGEIRGGAETVLGALTGAFSGVMTPAFTLRTQVIPEDGPAHNGLIYGSGREQNAAAEYFNADMPADENLGALAETLRRHPVSRRSDHPLLSFAGLQVDSALDAQTLRDPLAPVQVLADQEGWVLLLGVDHTANFSIHLAERMAGRRHFVRWALTRFVVRECSDVPVCSAGFEAAAEPLQDLVRGMPLGSAQILAVPMQPMLTRLAEWMRQEPNALLCGRAECLACADAVLES